MGSKNNGGLLNDLDKLKLTLTVGVSKRLLSALSSQTVPDAATARTVALAIVRTLGTGGGGKKGK